MQLAGGDPGGPEPRLWWRQATGRVLCLAGYFLALGRREPRRGQHPVLLRQDTLHRLDDHLQGFHRGCFRERRCTERALAKICSPGGGHLVGAITHQVCYLEFDRSTLSHARVPEEFKLMYSPAPVTSGRLVAVLALIIGFFPSPRIAAQDSTAAGAKPGSAAWANFDFVPGERVIFAEDFSRDRVGNFPQRFELVSGNMEVVEWQGKRWLRMAGGDGGSFVINLPEKLPQRFTVEFDLTIPWNCLAFYSADAPDRLGCRPDNRASGSVTLSGTESGVQRPSTTDGSIVDPRSQFPEMFAEGNSTNLSNRPYRIRLEADGRYVKLYLDEQRIANIPNADFGRANKLIFEFQTNSDSEGKAAPPLLRSEEHTSELQ